MKLSDLGRGAHLQIRKAGGIWRATLRINTDHHGAGVQTTSASDSPSLAVADALRRGEVAIGCLAPEEVPAGASAALEVATRVAGCGCAGGDMALAAESFADPTLAYLAGMLARAEEGRSVGDGAVTLVGDEMGWRGGGMRASFGNRRPFARRYARPRGMPARRWPGRGYRHPHPWRGARPAPAPWPYEMPYPYPYPADDGEPGDVPGAAPAPDDASDASPAAPAPSDPGQTPTPAAPSRGKMPGAHPAAPAPADPAVMGWNPFHAIANAVHHAIHFAAHPPTWAQVIFPVLSPAAQKFAAEHVLGKQGDKLFSAYQHVMDAAAAGHAGAKQLLAAVPQIAQVAQAAAQGGAPAVAQVAQQAASAGGAPDLNAIAQQAAGVAQEASSAASEASSAIDAVEQAAALMGWSPSMFYGEPLHPSWGLPTRRPIGFADAWNRIYGPQPGYFTFPKP